MQRLQKLHCAASWLAHCALIVSQVTEKLTTYDEAEKRNVVTEHGSFLERCDKAAWPYLEPANMKTCTQFVFFRFQLF